MARQSAIEEKYIGSEPQINSDSSSLDIIKAYNYYQYYYTAEDAKSFVIAFLKSRKVPKTTINKAKQLRPSDIINIGWNCRIMSNGGSLPEEIRSSSMTKLQKFIDAIELEKEEDDKPVISIQERIENKASEIIAELEDQIDFFINGDESDMDVGAWFTSRGVKPAIAKHVTEFYAPLADQIYEVIQGKDADLKYAYRKWKKPALKKYLAFINSILSASEVASVSVKGARKPRKKKIKPAGLVVAKLKYKEKDDEYNITSVKPVDIVGSQQLWVFNSKTRALSVYNALGPTGLSVKGTTLVGFDEKSSITKKIRKPNIILPRILEGGKIVLRKVMDEIKTAEKPANGRLNIETVLIRILK
jgi:hypothetical protein